MLILNLAGIPFPALFFYYLSLNPNNLPSFQSAALNAVGPISHALLLFLVFLLRKQVAQTPVLAFWSAHSPTHSPLTNSCPRYLWPCTVIIWQLCYRQSRWLQPSQRSLQVCLVLEAVPSHRLLWYLVASDTSSLLLSASKTQAQLSTEVQGESQCKLLLLTTPTFSRRLRED